MRLSHFVENERVQICACARMCESGRVHVCVHVCMCPYRLCVLEVVRNVPIFNLTPSTGA